MNLTEPNVDTVLKWTRKRLVRATSKKFGKGYYLNARIHLNQFKTTATCLKK